MSFMHGSSELKEFAQNVWIADGPDVRDMGILFTTRMTVVKLSSGALWVSSPVAVPFETLKQIADLGPVKYLVAATPRHVWRLEAWRALFPEAELWTARKTPFTLKKGRLPAAGVLDNAEHENPWLSDFDLIPFKGNPLIEEVIFFHKISRTLILDDLIQIHPEIGNRPLLNALIRLVGVAAPHGGVAIDIRLSFINRKLARKSLEKLLSRDFDKLIVAHGDCVEKDAKPFVERAFRWLSR